jgi:hypothetical protein
MIKGPPPKFDGTPDNLGVDFGLDFRGIRSRPMATMQCSSLSVTERTMPHCTIVPGFPPMLMEAS